MLTLEFEEKHAKVAQENLQRAGLHDCTEIRVGDARQTLEEIVKSGRKYDMIFIDADKPGEPVDVTFPSLGTSEAAWTPN